MRSPPRCMPAGGAGPFGAPPRHERTRRVAPRARAAAATATSSARRRPTCAARACARTCRPAAPTAASAASSASACPTCRRAAAPARFAPVKQAPQLARQALGQSSARSALQCARPRTAPLRALLPATAQQHADPMRRRSCAWAAACPAACPSLADPPLALSRCMHAAHAGVPALRDHSWAECAAHRRLHRAARDSAAARVRAGSYPDSDLQPAPAPRPKRALRRVPDAPRRTRARADGAVRGRQLHRHLPQRCAHQVPDRQRPLLRQPADRPQLLRLLRQLLPGRPQQPRHARLHRRRARPPPSPPLARHAWGALRSSAPCSPRGRPSALRCRGAQMSAPAALLLSGRNATMRPVVQRLRSPMRTLCRAHSPARCSAELLTWRERSGRADLWHHLPAAVPQPVRHQRQLALRQPGYRHQQLVPAPPPTLAVTLQSGV